KDSFSLKSENPGIARLVSGETASVVKYLGTSSEASLFRLRSVRERKLTLVDLSVMHRSQVSFDVVTCFRPHDHR
ncbi:hypothetical protein, partial [Haloquadratum walsbyi]|uniref:hypothetical protein n=1 Tax=Haloquadratum walsbyi TaxID=293091 RepID=UPI001AD94C2B